MRRTWGRDTSARRSETSAARPKHRDSQILAPCNMLRLKGFELYRNVETDAVAAYSSGFIFEFERISLRKAQQFFAWFQAYESTHSGLSTVPIGVKVYRIRKWREGRGGAPISNPSRLTAWHRPSIAIGGLHSTVPGHYAELDWNDLAKRY
jgi:hypothetical protein